MSERSESMFAKMRQEFGPVAMKFIYDKVRRSGLPRNTPVREENSAVWKSYESSGMEEAVQSGI